MDKESLEYLGKKVDKARDLSAKIQDVNRRIILLEDGTEVGSFDIQVRMKHKNGSYSDIRSSILPLNDYGTQAKCMLLKMLKEYLQELEDEFSSL